MKMKNIFLILIATVTAISCSNNLEDLNQNIKDPSSVSGESLFSGAQKSLVDQMVTLNVNDNNTKLWSQYLQETTYTDESNYDQVTRSIPLNHWSAMYKDVLKDLDEASKIINATDYIPAELNELKTNKLAIIEILNVYTYANLVETFGDVPYTEALDINNLTPKYDDGLTIYKDLLDRLDTAINSLEPGVDSFGSNDLIYKGDVSKWEMFATSLKLRMGILLADVEPELSKATVISAYAGNLIMDNSENAAYIYRTTDPNTNPIFTDLVLSGRQDFVAGQTIITQLDSVFNDPRLSLYFEPVDGEFVGAEIGATAPYSTTSKLAERFNIPIEPGILFDYSEVQFLLAEAAARGYSVGDVETHYNEGITASILYWGGTQAQADAYLAQANVAYASAIAASDATTPWKEVIGTQKWIALFNRGMEAWTSIRLLDYPEMATPIDALSGYPNRYTYPVVEQTINPDSWNEASSAIGGDQTETMLFWDLN